MNKKIILAVDDNQQNLSVLAGMLMSKYKVSFAHNGETALKALSKMTPDLILLDIMMPEMTGYEVCEKIKSDNKLKDIPIIFLTARTETDDMVKGFDLGAVDYITKPFSHRELLVRIENHIRLNDALNLIKEKNAELENINNILVETKKQLEIRNKDLVSAHLAVEEHAHQVNKLNQKLFESESNLKATNQNLETTIKEKDKLFSIIAHDLKSPFSSILNMLKLLDDEGNGFKDAEKRDYLKMLRNSSENIYKLLENLLEWSLIQRGLVTFHTENILLNKVLETIINAMYMQLKQKEIILINKVRDNLPMAVDANMVNTIVRNLLSNAVKFTARGGTITIDSETNASFTQISIKDTGIGIPERFVPFLFKAGEDISRHGTEDEPSTGLGLILCKEYVERHEGKIWVESEEGKGSTFYFTLPKAI